MSNPRKFGNVTLLRVTRAMPLDKAKRKAATIRKSGVQARVDSFQGKYAVWANVKKVEWKSKTKKPKTIRVEQTVRKLIKKYNATPYQINRGQCEVFAWDIYRLIPKSLVYETDLDSDAPTHFWVKISNKFYDAEAPAGVSDFHDLPLFKRAKAKHVGSYVIWTDKGGRRVSDKKPQRAKIITLYHGTTSKKLPEIRRTKRVIGYWTTDIFDASRWAVMFVEDKPVAEYGHPIILVSRVPENKIIWDSVPFHARGFKWKGGTIRERGKGHGSGQEVTARLPVRYITQVLHYKSKQGLNPIWYDFINKDFNRKDWVAKKSLADIPIKRPKMITIYHGTSSDILKDILKSKRVIGEWSTNVSDSSSFLKDWFCDSLVSEEGYPILIVAKVPEELIVWKWEWKMKKGSYNQAIGFKVPKGIIDSVNGKTGNLPIKYVSNVYHYKPRGRGGRNVSRKRYGNKFIRSDWTKRKL